MAKVTSTTRRRSSASSESLEQSTTNVPRPLFEPSAGPETFASVVLPHLDAANRLARWLMRNEDDADDVVQEASLRALRYFHTFTGGNARAWFLRIVRNTCRSWHNDDLHTRTDPFDEGQHSGTQPVPDPEALLLQSEDAALITQAMSGLPGRHRELLVFRELQGLSYQEMADVMRIPVGTVMSGLSRAREAFRKNSRRLSAGRHQRSAGSNGFNTDTAAEHSVGRVCETCEM